jgi:hypothetical protein
MPLYIFTGRYLSSGSRKSHRYVRKILNELPEITIKKIDRILNDALNETINSSTKFVYARSGFILGHESRIPKADHSYVWRKLCYGVIGQETAKTILEEEAMLRGIGAYFQWVVSRRPELWLVKFTEIDRISLTTGRVVSIAEYWIDQGAFQRKYKINCSMEDLMTKFNQKSL